MTTKEGYHRGYRGPNRAARANPWFLTDAEYQIVVAICAGNNSYKDIAQSCGIKIRTVQTHLMKIRDKLDADSIPDIILHVLSNPAARERCFPHLQITERTLL